MRFLILVRAAVSGNGAEVEAYHAELDRAGALLDASEVARSVSGWRIRWRDREMTLREGEGRVRSDGVTGYTIIDVSSREEALEWARRFPPPGDAEIEVWPLA